VSHCEFGFRLKEIETIVGITEGAVFKRLKNYSIPTNPRNKPRINLDVLFTGKKRR